MQKLLVEPETTIINFSALAVVKETQDSLPWYIGKLNPNIRVQWFSFMAFLELCNRPSKKKSRYCSSCFTTPRNLAWLVTKFLTTDTINLYKAGQIDTPKFLKCLLKEFSFLLTEEELNQDTALAGSLLQEKDNLITLRKLKIAPNEILTNELIALALLERAWVARNQYRKDSPTRVKYFFDNQSLLNSIIIANSNPLDMWHSVRHLKQVYPAVAWLDDDKLWEVLERPEHRLEKGISLTEDGSVRLYVSYAHRAFKTGTIPETGRRTDNQLELIMASENLHPKKVSLISQWDDGDLKMGRQLGFSRSIKDVDYFKSAALINLDDENQDPLPNKKNI